MNEGEIKMNTIAVELCPDFHSILVAPERAPEIPESADVYGWLVGSWELEVRHYWIDARGRGLKGAAHFSRVLQGRAIQDVWIIPRVNDHIAGSYGTTLRVWDAKLQAWRVTWINPVTGARNDLIGRWSGSDIVQLGTNADGTPVRWTFTEITNQSFLWKGESLGADGQSWILQGEFFARRFK